MSKTIGFIRFLEPSRGSVPGGGGREYIARKESNDEYRFLRKFSSVKFRFVHSTRLCRIRAADLKACATAADPLRNVWCLVCSVVCGLWRVVWSV